MSFSKHNLKIFGSYNTRIGCYQAVFVDRIFRKRPFVFPHQQKVEHRDNVSYDVNFWAGWTNLHKSGRTIRCSAKLKFIPMHWRAPLLKGIHVMPIPDRLSASPPGKNRSGLNTSGSLQMRGVWCISWISMPIFAPLGINTPFSSVSSAAYQGRPEVTGGFIRNACDAYF